MSKPLLYDTFERMWQRVDDQIDTAKNDLQEQLDSVGGSANNDISASDYTFAVGVNNKTQQQVDNADTTDVDESTLNTELKQIALIGQENVASGSKNSLLVGIKCRTDTVDCDKASLTNYTAFAGGYNSKVHHSAGFAWGINNEVSHKASGVIGNFLYTSAPNQFVTGRYNAYDTAVDSSLASANFVVGSGSSNTNRKNCFVTGATKTTINSTNTEINGALSANSALVAGDVSFEGSLDGVLINDLDIDFIIGDISQGVYNFYQGAVLSEDGLEVQDFNASITGEIEIPDSVTSIGDYAF